MNNYLKNPFNYQGGKYKILQELENVFPKNINTFVDVFGGSGEVLINSPNAKYYWYNEKCSEMYYLFKSLIQSEDFILQIENLITKYNLSKTNKEGFNQLREDYNLLVRTNSQYTYIGTLLFYCLICYSFNNQFGFNQQQEYNIPFGKNRSSFNKRMKYNLEQYIDYLHSNKNLKLTNESFENLFSDLSVFNKNDFFYFDPPYLITVGGYERTKNLSWDKEKEILLLDIIDTIDKQGYKFVLSNVLKHKGKDNIFLQEWAQKYNVHYINRDYSNCNYQTNKSKDLEYKTMEVIITNY